MNFQNEDLDSVRYIAEGACNIVFSYRNNLVLRIRKKTSYTFYSYIDQLYFHKIFKDLFSSAYVVPMEKVLLSEKHLEYIKKNNQIQCDLDLSCITSSVNLRIVNGHEDVICFDLKLKFGSVIDHWFSNDEGSCRFCLMQSHSKKRQKYAKKSKYCPIKLFSGDPKNLRESLFELMDNPQNNLGIYMNSKPVTLNNEERNLYSDLISLALLTPERNLYSSEYKIDFSKITRNFSHHCSSYPAVKSQNLPNGCILEKLRRMQEITSDTFVSAKKHVERITKFLDESLKTYDSLIHDLIEGKITDSEIHESTLRLFALQLALTARDCQIIISCAKYFGNEENLTDNQIIISSPFDANQYIVQMGLVDVDSKNIFNLNKRIEKEAEIK